MPSTEPPPAATPARVLGPLDATCVVIGAIIGVGIFFNPSKIAALTGSGTLMLAAWALAGVIAMCGALTFAELGARCHAPGAQYEILRDAYGRFPAFLFVFCNATAIQPGAIGIIAIICAQNLAVAAGQPPLAPQPLLALAILLIVALTAANIIGVRWGSRIQNLTVYCKVLTLCTIAVLAAAFGSRDAAAAASPRSARP